MDVEGVVVVDVEGVVVVDVEGVVVAEGGCEAWTRSAALR